MPDNQKQTLYIFLKILWKNAINFLRLHPSFYTPQALVISTICIHYETAIFTTKTVIFMTKIFKSSINVLQCRIFWLGKDYHICS